MPRFLSYERNIDEVRDVAIPFHDGSNDFVLRVRRTPSRMLVETIAGPDGRIASVGDVVRESRLSVNEIRRLISTAFEPERT